MQSKRFAFHAVRVVFLVLGLSLLSAAALAQQSAAPEKKSEAGPADSRTSPPVNVQGLDPKTGIPLYETIEEDWTSLEIGKSHLVPLTPTVTPVEEQDNFTRQLVQVQWRP